MIVMKRFVIVACLIGAGIMLGRIAFSAYQSRTLRGDPLTFKTQVREISNPFPVASKTK